MENNLAVPVAIVIAGALIAGAVYFGARGDGAVTTPRSQAGKRCQEPFFDLPLFLSVLT